MSELVFMNFKRELYTYNRREITALPNLRFHPLKIDIKIVVSALRIHVRILCIGLNKGTARRHLVAH